MQVLEPLDADLLELGPIAGAVGLELYSAFLHIFQLVILTHRVAIDSHQTAAALYDQVEWKPLIRLDFRVNGPLEVIERTCWKMGFFHIVQLNFVVPAAQTLAGGPEQNAAVVFLAAAHVHAQLEITEFLLGGQMPLAVRP